MRSKRKKGPVTDEEKKKERTDSNEKKGKCEEERATELNQIKRQKGVRKRKGKQKIN